MHELSLQQARRIAVRAQLLDEQRPADLLTMVRGLTLLQNDLTAAIAPNADLVGWSRLGHRYAPLELADAVAGRALVEYRGMIRPAEDIALYRADMGANLRGEATGYLKAQLDWMTDNDACRRDILSRLAADGPLTSRELPDTCVRGWRSSGWNNDRNVAMMLDVMELSGQVASAGMRGRDRTWDLAERVYPDEEVVPAEQARRMRDELRLRSLGLARAKAAQAPVEPSDVSSVGEPAQVEGVRGTWRVDPGQLARLEEPFAGRVAIISPLDRLVYDRKRMAELFEFDYQLEMFKPKASRRWGYFALPILAGDRLVGKLDATADRSRGVLRINAIHEDRPFGPELSEAVDAEIASLSRWLELPLEQD